MGWVIEARPRLKLALLFELEIIAIRCTLVLANCGWVGEPTQTGEGDLKRSFTLGFDLF